MKKYEIPTDVSRLDEAHERLYGALIGGKPHERDGDVDLSINRFSSTDNYVPHDITKNPAAVYAFENGFDELFPATLLASGKLGQVAVESGVIVATAEQAAGAIEVEELKDDPIQQDHARSSLALHHLYADRLAEAEATLAKIKDLGFATHVLAQIVKAGDEQLVDINKAHQREIEEDLRQKAQALAKQHDAHLATVLGEAAEALHDPTLQSQAISDSETHIHALDHSPDLQTTQVAEFVASDGTHKVDMSAFL